jgi:ribosomal protein S18 acetylase RimI-like enzyme
MTEPIRVWLEPGYDYGRTGAWMLDYPGCFSWAAARERALATVPSAVGGFVDWLLEHGEATPFPDSGEVAVIEELPVTREDGYERNATFDADRRLVTPDEIEAMARRLQFARDDLRSLTTRVTTYESEHGSLPSGDPDTTGRDAEPVTKPDNPAVRTSHEVLRHIAGVEIWLTSRLDRRARFEGASRDGDVGEYLRASRSWMLDRIRALHARDPASEGVDGKGEAWTLAKVVRRLVYHSLDHLHELDDRLARAERVVELLTVDREPPDIDALARLLAATGFVAWIRDRARLEQMVAGSTETFSVWRDARLIAFARTLGDGAFNAYVSTVAVHPRWQGRGVGRLLMNAVVGDRDGIKFVLDAREGVHGFYRSLGFEPSRTTMARRPTR